MKFFTQQPLCYRLSEMVTALSTLVTLKTIERLANMRLVLQLIFMVIAFAPATGFAEDNGRIGQRSEGQLEISLSILPSVQIETVNDVQLNIIDRAIDAVLSEFFCVKGHSTTRYNLIAAGSSNNNNAFILNNQANETLNYHVGYRGLAKDTVYDQLTSGIPSNVYPVIDNSRSCREGASIQITFKSGDLQNVTSGLFSGSLTLLVSPL